MAEMSTTPSLQVRLHQREPIPLAFELSCAAGELVALVGPSGSGKTTALRAIAGLYQPGEGRISCDGEVWYCSERRIVLPPQARSVGLVFQDYALFPHLTALGNVSLALSSVREPERTRKAVSLLQRVNLEGLEARKPAELSGGQRQRVALARALAREPRVLLLDEPFSAVDRMTRERLKRELSQLRQSLRIPILLVTHDMEEALALADRVVVLHRGTTLASAAPDEVRLRPPSPLVARLMGQTNVFSGVVIAPAMEGKPGWIGWNSQQLEVAHTGPFKAGDRVAWLAPLDHVVLHRRGRPSLGERENPVSGRVGALIGLGEQTLVTLEIDGAGTPVLNFRVATHAVRRNEVAPGAMLTVSLLSEGIHLMAPEA